MKKLFILTVIVTLLFGMNTVYLLASEEKNIKIGIINIPSTLNPLVKDSEYLDLMFLPLVQLNNDITFVPMMAEEITTEDNMLYTIKLVDTTWTDGTPVTVDDVIFTMELFTSKTVSSLFTSFFKIIEGTDDNGYSVAVDGSISGATKIDDHTMTLKMKKPVRMNAFKSTIGIKLRTLPKHVLANIPQAELEGSGFFRGPTVSFGPFKFVPQPNEQFVKFEANETFFRGAPKVDNVYLVISDTTNITMQLILGEIDMNDCETNIAIDDYERILSAADLLTNAVNSVINNTVIFVNNDVVSDARVRKAISLAIDRGAIINGLMKGYAENSSTHYTMGNPYFDPEYSTPVYDPKLAKQLLDEAKWDYNTVLKFDVGSGNVLREHACEMVVENLKGIGLQVQIQKMDFSTLLSKARKHDFEMTILGMSTNPMVSDYSNILSSSGSFNLSNYFNPDMDKLLQAGLNEIDEGKRVEIYSEVQRLYSEDVPVFAIYQTENIFVTNKRVTGGVAQSFGMYVNAYLWDIE